MECQVQNLAASSNVTDEVTVPEGKVESVCREWLIREDGVLAYKLQSEEIQHHYGHNKERSQILRSDFLEARTAQQSEEEEAAMMQLEYERFVKEQEDIDAQLAQKIQESILKEDLECQKRIEEEDERIALELQKKEKLRLQRKREERELRQAEKARAELSSASNSSSVKSMDDVMGIKETATSPLDKSFSLLSLEPPEDLTPEEFESFVQRRDAELAKLLHHQETRARSDVKFDQQIAIEAQDRELAKVLQEQERAKARRARERAKQKAALALDGNKIFDSKIQDPSSAELSNNSKERSKNPDCPGHSQSFTSNYLGNPINNIAVAIDPTFNSSQSFPNSVFTASPARPLPSSVSDVPLYSPSYLEDDFLTGNTAAPPYMPIQGTRRTSSLEKSKKSRKSKDGCKTQ